MRNLKTMLSSEDMTWETPQDFYDSLNAEFNFTLDPLLYLAERIANTKWYNGRSGLVRELKHWTEKLARYKELKEEFS